jgi:hypothetical protein
MRHNGVERIGISHGRERLGMLDASTMQDILIQHLPQPYGLETGMKVIECGSDLVDDGHVVFALEQSVRQFRA